MKNAIILIVVFILSAPLPGCDSGIVSRDKIFSYVNDHYKLLENFPYHEIEDFAAMPMDYETQLKFDDNEKEVIENYLGSKTIVKSVYAYNENILQYTCGASGLLDTGSSVGFYYSKNDTPFAFEFGNVQLNELRSGVFEWHDDNYNQNIHHGHKIQTEKIRDHWYYYMTVYK